MRRAFPITLLLLLSATLILNSLVDLSGLGSRGVVARLAAAQGDGQILVAETDLDQRAWVRARVRAACPVRLIAGSSTVGGLSAAMFGDGAASLNAWMTGPTLEDYEALLTVLEDAGCRPQTVVLGIDPWLLDRAQRNDRWLTLYWELVRYRGRGVALRDLLGPAVLGWSTFKDRLSFTTTLQSARWIYARSQRATRGTIAAPHLVEDLDRACADAGAELRVRYADGHFVGCPRFALPPIAVQSVAGLYVTNDPHGVVHSRELDTDLIGRLREVVARHRARGAAVVLLTPPYHPTTYAALQGLAPVRGRLDALDDALRDMAAATGARFMRLRDPAAVGCAAGEFADSHHASSSCLGKEARIIVAGRDEP